MTSWRKRLGAAVALLALAASTGLLFAPLLRASLTAEERFLEWDVPEQYWPDLVYLCGALHDGELPSWNPYDRAGYPFYADPQAGAYNPVNWAICALAGPSPSLAWAELRVVLGFFLAGAFGLLWLRRLGLGEGPALLGAVVIQAAPFMRHNWELNLTTGLAFLPLLLWAAERVAVERRLVDGALLGLSLGLAAWVGSPPALWLAGTFAAPYLLVRWASEARARGRGAALRGLLVIAVAALFALGFTLVVLVPGAGLAAHSVQAGRDLESLSAGGLELSELRALVTPRPGNHLYVGLVALALAPLALLPRGRAAAGDGPGPLPARWLHLAMAVVAVLMALGSQGPLFRLAAEWVPGVGLFRLPHRYEAWLGPSLGALAAGGLAWLSTAGPASFFLHRRRALRVAAALLGSAGLGLALLGRGRADGPALLLVAGSVVAAAASARRLGPSHLLVGVVLSALLAADATRSLPPDRHTLSGPGPASLDATEAILAAAPEGGRGFRYMDEFGISCRSGTRLGLRDLRGYQDPLLLRSYERVVASLRDHPRLLEQLNVRYVLTGPHFIHGWERHYLPPPAELLELEGARDRGHGVVELPDPLPLAYWVPRSAVRRLPDRPAALRRLVEVAPAAVALLDGAVTGAGGPDGIGLDEAPEASPGGGPGAPAGALSPAEDLELGRDRLAFGIEAPGPGLVVVSETWYPGWRARVDGSEVPIHRVNALFRGVFVEGGRHRVEMRFRPADGAATRWLLLATWIAFAAVVTLRLRRARRSGAAP